MQVQNARRWPPRGARRWIAAIAALFIASGVRLLLHPLLGPVMPGTAFSIAAVLIEYYFGLAPALTVMLAGLCIADFLFVPPYAMVGVINRSDVLFVISYPLVALVFITLVERLRRVQFRVELIASVAQSRYEMLLRHDNERMLARRAVDETHRLLRHLSQYHKSFVLIQALERTHAGVMPSESTQRPPAEIAPGPRFDDFEPDDIRRVSNALWPGSHRLRMRAGGAATGQDTAEATGDNAVRLVDCVCERFTTHAGDFLVLRIGE
jgi:K+-sensing histidine kinase KdpD